MESAAAFGSIFTGGGGAPMIFSRRQRHKKTGGGGVRQRQTIYKKILNTFKKHVLSQPGGESQAQRRIAGW